MLLRIILYYSVMFICAFLIHAGGDYIIFILFFGVVMRLVTL